MANQSISFTEPSEVNFTSAECVSQNIELVSNKLRTCIQTILGIPGISSDSYILTTTISSITDNTGQYNGENIVSVTANITDVNGNPVSSSNNGSTVFVTWNSNTPDFGNICNYTVVTDQATYTLDQTCYSFTSMTFTPNNGSAFEDCNETPIVITRT